MTERKPPGMSTEDWVRYQIRTAEERGAFRDLPLTGRPLPDSALRPDRDWLSEWVQRERLDTSVLLPVSILLAREVEQLPARLAAERSEQRVREIVVELDDRIRAAYRQVLVGPPMRTPPLDIEARVDRWRAARPPEPEPPAMAAPPAAAAAVRPRRSTATTIPVPAVVVRAVVVTAVVVLAVVVTVLSLS